MRKASPHNLVSSAVPPSRLQSGVTSFGIHNERTHLLPKNKSPQPPAFDLATALSLHSMSSWRPLHDDRLIES